MMIINITLQKNYKTGDIEIPKGAQFEILEETRSGYKLRYLGYAPNLESNIFYMHKHWFHNEEKNSRELTFKNKEFVLPEKWCILKNKKSICDYFTKKTQKPYSLESKNNEYLHHPDFMFDRALSPIIMKGYKEITFEEFEKYVLKKDVKTNNFKELGDIKLSLDDIATKLAKHYDKEDIHEILKILKE